MTYRIRGWKENFEVSQTRHVKNMNWVAVPNKHDGKSYRRLMKHERAGEVYAAWMLLIQVASRCPERGTLADEDGPLTADDLEMKTGLPASVYEMAMPVLCDPKIGWLTEDPLPETKDDAAPEQNPASPEQTTTEPEQRSVEPPQCDVPPLQQTVETEQQTVPTVQDTVAPEQRAAATLQDITGQDIAEQESILSPSPQTESEPVEEIAKPPQSYRKDFEAFYEAYPRKVSKDDAARKYEFVQKRIQAQNVWGRVEVAGYLVERAKAYARSRVGKDPKFTPHPSTWLNQGRYLDDDAEWNRSDNARPGIAAGDGQVASGDTGRW